MSQIHITNSEDESKEIDETSESNSTPEEITTIKDFKLTSVKRTSTGTAFDENDDPEMIHLPQITLFVHLIVFYMK